MGLASDIKKRADALARLRYPWEKVWQDTVKYSLVSQEDFFQFGTAERQSMLHEFALGPKSFNRGKELYDHASVVAVDRLTSGVLSLVTPDSDKWHGVGREDPLAPEAGHEEMEWFDRVRDYLFHIRYNALAGFRTANQNAIRSAVALGTGVYIIKEAFGGNNVAQFSMPVHYQSIPLSECYIAQSSQGVPDTLFRRFSRSARQLVQEWGEFGVSAKVRGLSADEKTKDRLVEVIHAVFPREEFEGRTNRDSAYASVHIEVDGEHLLGVGGYFEFPYAIYYWSNDGKSGYGESPVQLAMAEIKSLNLLAKQTLKAVQQWTNPPLGMFSDGTVRDVDLNPSAVNPGAVDENGRLLIQPLVPAQNPTFIQQVMEVKRDQLRDALFINLFQVLVQNPEMSATEALIRANEKGELLGPAGSKIMGGLAQMNKREMGILVRKGAFNLGEVLEPPEELEGAEIGIRFTTPLDRLRRSNELLGVQRTYEFAGAVAEVAPEILDRLDHDKAIDLAQEINGAPRTIMRSDEEVAERRAQRQQQEQLAQGLAAAQAAGQAAGQLAPAASELNDLAQSQDTSS